MGVWIAALGSAVVCWSDGASRPSPLACSAVAGPLLAPELPHLSLSSGTVPQMQHLLGDPPHCTDLSSPFSTEPDGGWTDPSSPQTQSQIPDAYGDKHINNKLSPRED